MNIHLTRGAIVSPRGGLGDEPREEIVDAPIGGISVVVFIISTYVPSIVQGVFVGSGTEAAKHPNWRRASYLIIKPSGPGPLVTSMAVTTPAQLATRGLP
ncbi:hypothetical protein [Bradyrhizobium pachyrhizi]|uniref:hypothetical protein n=1 Tax=Bradyrhizobium pachyrhizi TaxID=280333 RepID=UPI00067B246B|nr:hypothetical protein [Bradyrhizobium pachyrhizi]